MLNMKMMIYDHIWLYTGWMTRGHCFLRPLKYFNLLGSLLCKKSVQGVSCRVCVWFTELWPTAKTRHSSFSLFIHSRPSLQFAWIASSVRVEGSCVLILCCRASLFNSFAKSLLLIYFVMLEVLIIIIFFFHHQLGIYAPHLHPLNTYFSGTDLYFQMVATLHN